VSRLPPRFVKERKKNNCMMERGKRLIDRLASRKNSELTKSSQVISRRKMKRKTKSGHDSHF
jgi:hypothetical protein